MSSEILRLFVFISCFIGVFCITLEPSPIANCQRYSSLVLKCSFIKTWTSAAFTLENINIAFFINWNNESCRHFADPNPGLYQTSCDFNSSTINLTINNVTDDDDRKYFECRSNFGNVVEMVPTTINVQYPPTLSPSITQIPNGPVIEGHKITLICNITGGNPLASIVWQCIGFTNGSQIGNNKTAVSVIEGVVTKDDDGKRCTCVISHPLLDADMAITSTLDVYYPPSSFPSLTHIPNGPVIEGNKITLICNITGGNPLASIVWQCLGFINVSQIGNTNTAVSVIERVVTKDDDGKRCTCVIKHPLFDADKEVGATLNVYYPPTSTPSITQIPNGPVIEGNTITLICNITGGNPLASIVWKCIGFTNISQIGNIRTAVSIIERVVTKDDDGKRCTCVISHPLLDADKAVTSTLNVYYSPSSSSIVQTPLSPVNPGTMLIITCEIQGGKPLAAISWQCKGSTPISPTGNPITGVSISSVRLKVNIDDNGDVCMCVGSHPVWKKHQIYNLTFSVRKPVTNVTFTPANYNNVISVEDGVNETFTCTTDFSDLIALIQWYFDGQNITSQAIPQPPLINSGKFISSSKLIYTGKEEDINKKIYCEAVSIEGEYSVQSTVQSIYILFGPKSINLSPSGNLYIVTEDNGINILIICAAKCRPDCNYTWTGPNGFREHHFSLELNSVNRNQTGLYMCQAKNDYGSQTSNSINIVVNYAPTILRLQTFQSNNVDEHQSVTFQCEVDSKPTPDITWIHSTTGTVLNKVDKVFKSNFTIHKTECLQTGTYRCQASNVIGDMLKTAYAEIDLFVLCSARMDQRRKAAPDIVSIMENDELNITVYLIAYPIPMITWTTRNSETGIISLVKVNNSFSISEHSSTLSIRKISKSDYGSYTMNASNNIGLQYIKSFEVIPQDPPDQPTDILAACEITSMIVLWRSGFNGGSQQKFRVAWLNIRNQNTKYSPDIMDSGLGQTIQYIIKSLEPSTSYIIYVEATNKRGVVKSGNVNCITRSSLSQSNNTVAISVGASIGSSILILIIAVLVVLFLRKRPCNKEENSQLYQSTYPDTSRQKTTIDQHTYDELQTIKTGSNPEYEEANSVSTYEEIGIANLGSYYQNAINNNKESIQRHETSPVYANTQT